MQRVCLFLCVAAAGRDVRSARRRLSSLEMLFSLESPQLLDSCFLANFLFTVEMTLLALAAVYNTDIGWAFLGVCVVMK